MRVLVPLNNGLALVGNLPLLGLIRLKALNSLLSRNRGLNWGVSNGVQAVGAQLDIGMRDFIVHGRDELNARNVAHNLEDLGRVPELVDEGRVAGSHAAHLHRARAGVVHAVIQDIRAEDVAAVLEDSLVREQREGLRGGHGREGRRLQRQVLHGQDGRGRGVGQVLGGVELDGRVFE